MITKALHGNVIPEHAFHFYRQGSITNIYELVQTLQRVSDTSFSHHVTSSRNDFAQWIEDMYRNHKLAEELRSTRSKNKTIAILQGALDASEAKMQSKVESTPHKLPKTAQEKIKQATHHINHIHRHLKDHIHRNTKSAVPDITDRDDMMHFDIKKGMVEFGFGLILGIIIGLIFAKMMGIY